MSDLIEYLDEVVEPTIHDFENNPTSRRHAFLACVATCHAVDYLAYPDDPRTLRQKFGQQSPAFKLVDDVGHAFKHVIVGKRDAPRLKASEVITRPSAYWGEFTWDLSRWNDPIGGVTLNANREVDLLDAVKSAVAFLRAQIKGAGTASQP